jgi:hypothetical protein
VPPPPVCGAAGKDGACEWAGGAIAGEADDAGIGGLDLAWPVSGGRGEPEAGDGDLAVVGTLTGDGALAGDDDFAGDDDLAGDGAFAGDDDFAGDDAFSDDGVLALVCGPGAGAGAGAGADFDAGDDGLKIAG